MINFADGKQEQSLRIVRVDMWETDDIDSLQAMLKKMLDRQYRKYDTDVQLDIDVKTYDMAAFHRFDY